MTAATLTRDEAAVLARAAVAAYRPDDLARMDPFWDADALDAFSTECFGVPVANLIGMSADELLRDWRSDRLAVQP